ncbi:MAG: 1,2-phenylacetyl-CoA epoxidase subunit PaaA [Candidatus Dormibacteria bacterium]
MSLALKQERPADRESFLAHVQSGGKVEASDWMPDDYRAGVLKFLEMHANSEFMGAMPEREWIPRAPSLMRKLTLTAKVQDEVGHAQILYSLAEDLGKPRTQMLDDLVHGRSKFHNVFHYPVPTWGDVALIGWLVDGAALVTQHALLESSYAPYARALRRICAEESLHLKHGEALTLELSSGSPAQRAMFQQALDAWWEALMHFFGPPSDPAKDLLIQYRVKTKGNEQLRQEFIGRYVPRIWSLGFTLPDPALKRLEDGTWQYTPPDWDRLKQVVTNHGPESERRLALRRAFWRKHAAVRQLLD